MNLLKATAGAIAGFSVASASIATFLLTRTRARSGVDSAFFYSPFELGIPFETVTFYNNDGHALKGWWLEGTDETKALVLCPGYGRSKSDLLGIASFLWRAGYNILLFDFRDQGESDPAIASIGHFETDDLNCAIDYVIWRLPSAKIGLLGFSMGAATSIMVAAERTEVKLVVADSPYGDLKIVMQKVFADYMHLPPGPALELAELFVWLRAGYRFSNVRPIDVVSKVSPRPLLIIHSDCDGVSPLSEGEALFYAAGEPKEFWQVTGCAHCGAYFLDRQAYVDRVTGFVKKWLGEPARPSEELTAPLLAAVPDPVRVSDTAQLPQPVFSENSTRHAPVQTHGMTAHP